MSGLRIALATEGGHATLAVRDVREREVAAELGKRFDHVSFERVVTGPGLVNLHDAMAAIDGASCQALTPDQISDVAMNGVGCDLRRGARHVLRHAGNGGGKPGADARVPGGVYIGGGIVPQLERVLAASKFRARFEDKGRFRSYMKAIPTYIVTRKNPAILGLARHLREIA